MKVNWSKSITVEAFRPLYDSKALINLIWGGRDAAKTHNVGDILVYKCISQPYFKCILTRAVQGTIRGSLYSVVVNSIKRHGLESLFDWIGNPMEIRCINGNMFVGVGADDPDKIKSTDNPTDVWAEEADQIAMNAIDVMLTTLRSSEVEVQAWFTLNPEINPKTGNCDILERFIPDYHTNISGYYSDTMEAKYVEWTKTIEVEIRGQNMTQELSISSLHVMADHNPYANPSRIALYESYKDVDINKYNVWRKGHIGAKENENPFFKSEETDNFVYLDGKYEAIGDLPLRLSFDFNNDPCTVVICQLNLGEVREKPPGLYILETIQVKGGTELLADELIVRGIDMHRGLIEMTGDNSGRARKSNSLHSDVDILERKMRARFHTNRKVNELLKESRITVNYWLVHGKTYIYKDSNAALIKDLKTGEIDEKGGIKKDRNSHPQDAGDAFRYIFPEWLGATVSDLEKVFPRLRKAQAFWDKYKDHFK